MAYSDPCSIIIYCSDSKYLSQTINDLLDKTPGKLIPEILICDDGCELDPTDIPLRESDTVIRTDKVGKDASYKEAVRRSNAPNLVFLSNPTAFREGWLEPLVEELDHRSLVSPVTFLLDWELWEFQDMGWRRYGLRWNFTTYNCHLSSGKNSPLAGPCISIRKEYYERLDGSRLAMDPGPEYIYALSLEAWFSGGQIKVIDSSHIAVIPEIGCNNENNIRRLQQAWFPNMPGWEEYATAKDLSEFPTFPRAYKYNAEWWMDSVQPDLSAIRRLYQSEPDSRIAVVGDGPSLDFIQASSLNEFDIVIAIDYLGELVNADYTVTNLEYIIRQADVERLPSERGLESILVTPQMIKSEGGVVPISDVSDSTIALETRNNPQPLSVLPPLCDCGDNMTLLAIHFALLLGPKEITAFGCDNKILGNRSHTQLSPHYGDGRIWSDCEALHQRFASYEFGLVQLGKLAFKHGIPLIRVNHV